MCFQSTRASGHARMSNAHKKRSDVHISFFFCFVFCTSARLARYSLYPGAYTSKYGATYWLYNYPQRDNKREVTG